VALLFLVALRRAFRKFAGTEPGQKENNSIKDTRDPMKS
jgi:hypothetical protein